MDIVNLDEAATRLSELVERAAKGEEIIIAKGGRPLARLAPLARRTGPRPLGLLANEVHIGPAFDDPLPAAISEAFACYNVFISAGQSRDMGATLAGLPVHETRRLRLAPLRVGDAEALRLLTDDPIIIASVHFLKAPVTLADAEALIGQRENGRDCFLGAWSRGSETLIGVVGVHLRDVGQLEIGYWVGSAFHGQGYATEAALGVITLLRRELPEREVIAECKRANAASWRVLEKIGFRPTGRAGQRPGRELLALPAPSFGSDALAAEQAEAEQA